MKLLRKTLILGHRYLGLVLGGLIVVWFASGIVMMYAGSMPRLTPERRIDRLPPLDLSRVRLSPAEAVERVNAAAAASARRETPPSTPREGIRLSTVMERPAYRVGGTTVFADTGEILTGLAMNDMRSIAARFIGVADAQVSHLRTVSSADQWTIELGRTMPLQLFRVDDGRGTEVYVQTRTGDVVMATDRRSRTLAWMGAIPHWLYFNGLRRNQPLWYRLVVWTSAGACVVSVVGLLLGAVQFRRAKPFRLARAIPYAGWMRWHYVTGVIFGVFTLTWAFSGLLSMEPFAWTNAAGLSIPRSVFTGGPPDLAAFGPADPAAWTRVFGSRGIKEIEYARIHDDPYFVVRLAPDPAAGSRRRERLPEPYDLPHRIEPDRVLVRAGTLEIRREPFSTPSLVDRLAAALPDVRIVSSEVLTEYDSYYYARGRQAPLPVVRLKFSDPAATWIYVDPKMSQTVAVTHRWSRLERWLYNGLHRLDFAFWYSKRPLWDIGMLVLLGGGLLSSSIGLVLGVQRLSRRAVRAARAVSGTAPPVQTDLAAPAGREPRS